MGHQQPRIARDDPRVSYPLYSLREAARHLGVAPSTLYRWAHPGARRVAPLITTITAEGTRASLPFLGFAEAFVIKAALDAGVPHWRIRPGVEVIKREFGIEYALAHKRVYTDGAEILLATLDDENLTVARNRQKQLTRAVQDQLKLIAFAGDGFAERLRLPRFRARVIVDPQIAAGAPVLEHGGARVEDLRARYEAGDPITLLAEDFCVPEEEVREVVGAA